MALLTYVRSVESNSPLFAVISDDTGADYLFPDDVEPWLDDSRIDDMEKLLPEAPVDEAGWMEIATAGLGLVAIDSPVKYPDVEDAVTEADKGLAGYTPVDGSQSRLDAASDAYDEISQDYPDFGADEEATSPEAMNNYVSMMLGPIEPDGPNGWVLRAQEDRPEPGDEDQFLHFPGTPEPVYEEVEAEEGEKSSDSDDEDTESTEPADDEVVEEEQPDDEEAEPTPDDEEQEEDPA